MYEIYTELKGVSIISSIKINDEHTSIIFVYERTKIKLDLNIDGSYTVIVHLNVWENDYVYVDKFEIANNFPNIISYIWNRARIKTVNYVIDLQEERRKLMNLNK